VEVNSTEMWAALCLRYRACANDVNRSGQHHE